MKDSAKLLNFNVNRELTFDVFRMVEFGTGRHVGFNPNRKLSFDLNRDIGFGKRGVVFRGYVCPSCKAPVARDADRCDECGQVFAQQQKAQQPAPRKEPPKPATQPSKATAPKPRKAPAAKKPPAQQPQPRSTFQCPVCDKTLYVGAGACPGCGTRFASPTDVPRPPVQCRSCMNMIPPSDRFCRRCGAERPVAWQEDPSLERRTN